MEEIGALRSITHSLRMQLHQFVHLLFVSSSLPALELTLLLVLLSQHHHEPHSLSILYHHLNRNLLPSNVRLTRSKPRYRILRPRSTRSSQSNRNGRVDGLLFARRTRTSGNRSLHGGDYEKDFFFGCFISALKSRGSRREGRRVESWVIGVDAVSFFTA